MTSVRPVSPSPAWQTSQQSVVLAPHPSYSSINSAPRQAVSERSTSQAHRARTNAYADIKGRFCAPVPSLEGTITCCLPCPITDWVYSDGLSHDESYLKILRLTTSQTSIPYPKLPVGSMSQAWLAHCRCSSPFSHSQNKLQAGII